MIKYSLFSLEPSRAYMNGMHDKARGCFAEMASDDIDAVAIARYMAGWIDGREPRARKGAECWKVASVEVSHNA